MCFCCSSIADVSSFCVWPAESFSESYSRRSMVAGRSRALNQVYKVVYENAMEMIAATT
jgi:hypothetical protein